MTTKTTPILYRQGDVMVRRLDSRPVGDLAPVPPEHGRVILAHGELTGHCHALPAAKVTEFTGAGSRYFLVERPTALRHDEHTAIPHGEGWYETIGQQEYHPGAIRPVQD